jgi:hypothetical protein
MNAALIGAIMLSMTFGNVSELILNHSMTYRQCQVTLPIRKEAKVSQSVKNGRLQCIITDAMMSISFEGISKFSERYWRRVLPVTYSAAPAVPRYGHAIAHSVAERHSVVIADPLP